MSDGTGHALVAHSSNESRTAAAAYHRPIWLVMAYVGLIWHSIGLVLVPIRIYLAPVFDSRQLGSFVVAALNVGLQFILGIKAAIAVADWAFKFFHTFNNLSFWRL